MEEALVARLLRTGSLMALVGTRVFWQTRPAEASSLPAITLTVASDGMDYDMESRSGWQQPRIQFDVRGRSYLEMKKVQRALLSEMETADSDGAVHFDEAHMASGGDAPKETLAGGTEVFRYTMDLMVPFRAKE